MFSFIHGRGEDYRVNARRRRLPVHFPRRPARSTYGSRAEYLQRGSPLHLQHLPPGGGGRGGENFPNFGFLKFLKLFGLTLGFSGPRRGLATPPDPPGPPIRKTRGSGLPPSPNWLF